MLELESAKQSLENVNDSLRSQLDEVGEQGVDAEEMMRIRGELEETQAALTTAEDDVKTYQQELSDSQVYCLCIYVPQLYSHVFIHGCTCVVMHSKPFAESIKTLITS